MFCNKRDKSGSRKRFIGVAVLSVLIAASVTGCANVPTSADESSSSAVSELEQSSTSTNSGQPPQSIENPSVLEPVTSVTILGVEYDIATTTGLNLMGKNITDDELKQIGQLTNLVFLSLDFTQVNNITPLTGLINLIRLDLNGNQISDITPLSGLTNLTSLDLGHNKISDLTPLSGLTNLTRLDLSVNQISDLTPLSELTNLTKLYLDYNLISDSDIEQLKTKLPDCDISFKAYIQ